MSESMQDQESIAVNMSVSGENEQLSQQLDPQEVGSFARSSSRTQGAAGNCWREHVQRFEMMTQKSNFAPYAKKQDSSGQSLKECTTELARMNLGILLHHAESTLSRTHPHSEAKLWIYKYREIGPVLDVKLICHHNVHGVEIQILSTYGDDTKVWVVISRSSNRYVDELRHRESGNLPEEVAQECVQDQDTEHSKVRRPHSCS